MSHEHVDDPGGVDLHSDLVRGQPVEAPVRESDHRMVGAVWPLSHAGAVR